MVARKEREIPIAKTEVVELILPLLLFASSSRCNSSLSSSANKSIYGGQIKSANRSSGSDGAAAAQLGGQIIIQLPMKGKSEKVKFKVNKPNWSHFQLLGSINWFLRQK